MSKYETVVIFDGSLTDEVIAQEQQKIEELIAANGELLSKEIWGKRQLAYEISKKRTGFYSLFFWNSEADANKLVTDLLRFNLNIIRHMTVIANDATIVSTVKRDEPASEGGE